MGGPRVGHSAERVDCGSGARKRGNTEGPLSYQGSPAWARPGLKPEGGVVYCRCECSERNQKGPQFKGEVVGGERGSWP